MLLELKPDRQTGFKNPARQLGGVHLPKRCTEQDRAAPRQSLRAHDRCCPVEVGSIADDDLDLIRRLEPIDVGPDIGVDFAGTREDALQFILVHGHRFPMGLTLGRGGAERSPNGDLQLFAPFFGNNIERGRQRQVILKLFEELGWGPGEAI